MIAALVCFCIIVVTVGACFATLLICDARVQVANAHAGLAVSRERAERALEEVNRVVADAKAATARVTQIERTMGDHDARIAALQMRRG